ncbi:MAG: hypothetical protein BWY15_01388 [Firmicutes bacterium ADurb.Bin193]|nr:MAG: hypothetical protein BWY15_01388 [Firmicutes bacterium ADurb.Bin193]
MSCSYPFAEGRDTRKDFCCAPKHPKAKKIILECGHNPQPAIFDVDDEEICTDQEFVLDTVRIDTTCLQNPIVKIDFSSLIVFEVEGEGEEGENEAEVDLLFELVRICNGHKEVIQSWRYEKEVESNAEIEVETSEPFTVIFCDRACPGCCEYKMIVKGKEFDGDIDELRIVNPVLTALAQGMCDD